MGQDPEEAEERRAGGLRWKVGGEGQVVEEDSYPSTLTSFSIGIGF